MLLVVPMAGESSRFPNMRPKWLLTGADGTLMLRACLDGLDLRHITRVAFVVRRDHDERFNATIVIERQLAVLPLGVPHVVVVVDPTRSQPETVYAALNALGHDGPFFVKDVDNRYQLTPVPGNQIAVADLNAIGRIHAANKSYVAIDEIGQVTTIVEKSVVSNTFCVGGYGFASAREYREAFVRIQDVPGLYVSHVIFELLMGGAAFGTQQVEGFEDWGTLDEWRAYQRRAAALFVDLDGTLVETSSEFFEPLWGQSPALLENVACLNRLFATGRVQIFVTTSRRKEYEQITRQQLAAIGLQYTDLLLGVAHARRFLINDYSSTNPYPSAVAINLRRDTRDLDGLLASFLEGA